MALRTLPRSMWWGLGLIAVVGMVHVWLEYERGTHIAQQLKSGPEVTAHAHEVIGTAQALLRAVQGAERAQRGFLITGDETFSQAYRQAEAEVPTLEARLKTLTEDNPEQRRRWPTLEQQVAVKLNEMRRTLAVYESGGFDAARRAVGSSIGLDSMEGIVRVIDGAIATERALLAERMSRAEQFEHELRRAALTGAVLEFVGLGLGALLLIAGLRTMRRAEAASQDSEQHFRLFVGAVTDYAIYMLDPEGRVVEWNAGAQRIKGYTRDEIVGQHFGVFFTEEDRAAGRPQHELQMAIKHGRYEEEGWRVRKDGTRFLASVLLEPVRDASGRLLGFAKVTRDITERTQHQQALVQYQKMDALGQLTGGVAHDFNNLLHVIKNAVHILEHRLNSADPEIGRYLQMLKRNADRAASLTQRLLAFSRNQILDPRPVNPNALVADVTSLLEQVLGEGVAIETVLGAGVWWISVDSSQLETALLNLAVNARDAMAGSGKLTVETSNAFLDEAYAAAHAEVKPGQYVLIAVSDTGSGMTPEVVAKAFEPFFTTKEVGRGTGLGLSQVYGFVKQSGGHAAIYSEPGLGTSVKLYLPRLITPPDVRSEPRAKSLPRGAGHGTILVVEDDEDVARFTADVLAQMGYRVLSAGDAASALHLLDTEAVVDLLFTDIGLPGGVNGRQLADQALQRRPGLRVLFTTGYTRNAVVHHGRVDPGVDLIVKPFTQRALADAVGRAVGRTRVDERN
ncbi:MAG TPA: CHASE3 domain-containing protein [Burkholderiaceae bacterium]